MAFGTAQPQTFLSRVSRTLAAFDSAWKARAPDPGQFYPPQPGQWGGYINFPGWDVLSQRGNSNTVDEKRAKLAVQSPWVFSDISAIANEASAAELVVKERKPDGLEDVDNHEAELLWESPNPHMGRSFLISFWVWSYVLSSKAYLYWMPDSSGRITEIWPIPPFMIAPIPDEKDFIRGYAFKSNPAAAAIVIPAEYVTFSHSVNIFDVRDGLGFLVAAMLGIESDLAMEKWNRNFFEESNGIPDGLISVPRDTLDNDLIRIRQEVRDYFGGTKRGVGVARAGDMEYKPWGRSQKEIEFKEGIELISKVIGRTLGFPDGYWSDTANRANAEQARKTMIAGAVWPLLVRLAEDMNAQTIRRWWGAQYRASFKDIRPEDRELKLKEMTFFSTIETVDELRKRNGIEPIGDVRGLMLLAELNKGAPTPTSAPGQAIEDALAKAEEAAMAEEEELPPEDGALLEEEAENPEAAPTVEEEAKYVAWLSSIKHGKHDQSTHGRPTGRRLAYRAAYRAARAGGSAPADARAVARTASLEHRDKERAERRLPAPNTEGTTTRAYGLDPNKSYEMQHRLVDMKDIQASNTASGGINPNYDPSLQPRDRSRAASQAQIDQVARQMNPDVLVTDFHRIDAGSPIIDKDGNVLSGNGRTLAMQRAAELYPEQHAAYRARLKAEAEALGIDPRAIDKMENPVLVRQLKGDADPAAFAREANSSNVLRMSPLEQAKVDAGVLNEGHMLKLHVGEGQDIDRALRDKANKPFIDDFMKTVPDNERANLLTRDGDLNQMGLYRMKAAIYTKAFPGSAGERMAESMLESLDPEVKSIQTGISAGLPSFSRATSLARSGQRDRELDISDDFARVVDTYARIKDNPNLTAGTPANQLVSKYLSQASMFGRDLNPQQERLLVHLDQISRKPTAVRDLLTRYSQIVEGQPQPGQAGMFGNDRMTRAQLYDALFAGSAPAQTQGGLFG